MVVVVGNNRKNEVAEDTDLMRDQLSEFFGLISTLCQKAFSLIRQVFPAPAAPKVTRMLIDRLLNDPAFGIHVKVNEVLQADSKVCASGASISEGSLPGINPLILDRPLLSIWQDMLSVSDSLDMLTMVHEKTNALATLLIDYCVEAEQPESGANLEDDYNDSMASPIWPSARASSAASIAPTQAAAAGNGSLLRSQQALSSYVKSQFAELFTEQRESYLEKEVSLLRLRLVKALEATAGGVGLSSTEKRNKVLFVKQGSGESSNTLPALRAEKIDSYDVMLQGWLRKEVSSGLLGIEVGTRFQPCIVCFYRSRVDSWLHARRP